MSTDPTFLFFDPNSGDFAEWQMSHVPENGSPVTDDGEYMELFGIVLSPENRQEHHPVVAAQVDGGWHVEVMFAFNNREFKSRSTVEVVTTENETVLRVTVNRDGNEEVTDIKVS